MKDGYGNEVDPRCGYARGTIIKSPIEETYKALWARELLKRRAKEKGMSSIFNAIGLADSFPIEAKDLEMGMGEFTGMLFCQDKLEKLALRFMGGNPEKHDVTFCNRGTAAIIVAILVLAKKGTKVISFTPPPRSHSSVMHGVELAGAELIEVYNIDDFQNALIKPVSLVVLTGLTTGMKKMSTENLKEAIKFARKENIPIFLDDASGANFRSVLWDGPKSLELDVDLAMKSAEKACLYAPRIGILAGKKELIVVCMERAKILGMDIRPPLAVSTLHALEKYDPEQVRRTKKYCDELYELAGKKLGKKRLEPMDVGGINILEERCLEILIERNKNNAAILTPQEASVSVGMALLEDFGVMTVASWALPGCNWSLRLKPLFSEQYKMKAIEVINAIDESFNRVARLCANRNEIAKLLFGKYAKENLKN